MEGKECRFGVAASALFATVTTDTSCGAVNSMHDSFTPLGGLVPMANMQLGEIDLRRRRQRPLRHDRVRRADGLHCRSDGRTHARVSRKEDRAPRSAVGHPRDLGSARRSRCFRRPSRSCCLSVSPRSATTARTGSRRSSTRSRSTTENNGSAFAGFGGNTYLQRPDGRRDDLRAVLRSSFRRWRWPVRSPGSRQRSGDRRHVYDALADLRRAC